ncbi:PREDICTED: PRUPE_5G169200 [Prunus dulcis]|uniref:PREDICTED: PRUPE_5G169200 n=1 Tax=Prunus dulcis TaxID=3755 RepID=A0A5E4GB27_PRUDU|nr:hypothetical protein L3X38_000375 [Prunus dulcis]VVA36999.1 PREDICTED: PRUPE_5G169200 [Prunus dulcis]
MAQDLVYQRGFWMEGRVNNYNDMEEIRRMLRQLMERIVRIEARTQIGKSSDGEGCVNPYLNQVARIDTLSCGSLDREYEGDSLFHYCGPLCESSEEGHGYSHCLFEGINEFGNFGASCYSSKLLNLDLPPIFDPCNCENCNENCLGVQSNFDKQFIDQNSEEMRVEKTFEDIIDFMGINIFTWKVAKNPVDFVNRLEILERNICIVRGSKKPRITRSIINMKQLKILFGFSSIKGLNSRTNSFQP